jgi:transposase
MQDRQLYEQILGITAPWSVERVALHLEAGEVHVHLEHGEQTPWRCPQCDRVCPLHDHGPPRVWRHLDTCQYQTLLHAAIPRTKCPEHGVHAVRVSWSEPQSRFTALFERLVMDWLLAASQQAVAQRLDLSWDEVHGIMDRAVKRGLARRQATAARYLGVDEKSFRKGHRYVTVVTDLERSRVLYVAEDRQQASLDGFWTGLSPEQRQQVEGVAMDMWDPYVASTRAHLPGADEKIVYDKFHVAKHLGEGVDQVRRSENKALRAAGDERLVGTKYDWLRHPDHFADDADYWAFCELRRSNLKTARAWAMKEQAMNLWNYKYLGVARKHFDHWYRWVTHSRLPPMIKKAKMLKKRLTNILTYLKHGITNAASESLNAKIQWVKYTARGFRNLDNFKTAIYFHCGGLDLSTSAT